MFPWFRCAAQANEQSTNLVDARQAELEDCPLLLFTEASGVPRQIQVAGLLKDARAAPD
jgi:hypothetical protein